MNGEPNTDRLVLGTAQFGLRYGIANASGQIGLGEGAAILSEAWRAGMRMLDTAILYGDSERSLGDLGVPEWDVMSKLPEMPPAAGDANAWVRAQVGGSLQRLRISRLHGLLLHRPAQLLRSEGRSLYRALLAERDAGRVRHIGISIYDPAELDALPPDMAFGIVQAPWNILDQRMTRSGWAQRLEDSGCEFHARSIFLQGLLLMPSQSRPQRFSRWHTLFEAWDDWLAGTGFSALEACLQHAMATDGITRVVIGVDRAEHLRQVVAAARNGRAPVPLPHQLATDDPALLNPALWSSS